MVLSLVIVFKSKDTYKTARHIDHILHITIFNAVISGQFTDNRIDKTFDNMYYFSKLIFAFYYKLKYYLRNHPLVEHLINGFIAPIILRSICYFMTAKTINILEKHCLYCDLHFCIVFDVCDVV